MITYFCLCNQVNEDVDVKNRDLYDDCSHCKEFCTHLRGARACSSCAHLFCASCISNLKFCSLCGVEFFTNTNQECNNPAASPPASLEHNVSANANARIKSEHCDEKAEAEAPTFSTHTNWRLISLRASLRAANETLWAVHSSPAASGGCGAHEQTAYGWAPVRPFQ